jgi:hypothetical protein
VPRFWLTPRFCDFLAWWVSTTRPGLYRVLCTHLSQAAGPQLFSIYTRRGQHLQEVATPSRDNTFRINTFRRQQLQETTPSGGEHQQGVERSQSLWTLPGQNSKKMLHQFGLILLTPIFLQPISFSRRLYIVDAYILLAPIFSAASKFWSVPIFGWRLYVVDAYILLRPIF